MKQNLFNKLWLRVGMIVAIMTTALAGTAWAEDVTDVIDYSATSPEIGETANSTWKTFTVTGSSSGITYNIRSMGTKSSQDALRWNANGWLYMSTTYSGYKLKSVSVTTSANKNISIYASNTAYSAAPSGTALSTLAATLSGATYTFTSDYTYLALKGTASSTFITNITIVWEEAGSITPTYTVTYNANGGTGTMTDDNSPYEEDDEVTLLTNTFTAPEGMLWDSWVVKDAEDNEITVTDNKFSMPASNVTVTAQWAVDPNAQQYEWVATDLADLTSSDIFVIVGDNGNTYAMTNDNGASSAPAAVSVTIADSKITSIVASNIKWNISGNATDGYTFYPNGNDAKWLYCTNDNNGVRVGTNNNKTFTVDGGYLKHEATSRYVGIYNSSDWRCYTSKGSNIANQTFAFYKRVDADAPQAPSFTITNNDELAYDATSGSFDFSVNNPVTGGAITVSEDVDWISNATVSGNSVTFTTTANGETTPRTGVITLTYTYNTNETVTKEVTVTQAAAPESYTTIPALFEAATGTETSVYVTFNNWVVSGVSTNGKNVFVTDNNGNGFVIYSNNDQSSTYSAGSVLSGTAISCTLKKYNGFAELLNVDASDLTITTGGTVTAVNVAMADLAGVNTGALVSYENLTCSIDDSGSTTKYYLSNGTTNLQVYNALFAFDALEAGKTYNITGVYQQYNNTKEILPRSAADIVEVDAPVVNPTLTIANPANVTITATYGDSEILVNGNNATVESDTEVTLFVAPATGYTLATLTVTGEGGQNVTLTPSGSSWTFTMPAYNVTVNATVSNNASPIDSHIYELVTDASTLSAGDIIIIAYNSADVHKAMGEQRTNNRAAVDVVQGDNQIVAGSTVQQITLEGNASGWYFNVGDGYLYAASSNSNHLKTEATKDDNAKATIEIASGTATITFQGTNTRNLLKYNSGDGLFSCYATGQKAVQIYKLVEPTDVEVNITIGYSTLYYGDRNLVVPANVEAYTYKVTNKLEVSKTYEAGDVIPAGTAVVLEAANGSYTFENTTDAGEGDDDNALKGSDVATTTTGGTYYYALSLNSNSDLSSVGFYWIEENGAAFTCGAHKAYLALNSTFAQLAEGEVKGFIALPDDDATGIKTIETIDNDGAIYNVAGQRLNKMQKGINIVNGKKILK